MFIDKIGKYYFMALLDISVNLQLQEQIYLRPFDIGKLSSVLMNFNKECDLSAVSRINIKAFTLFTCLTHLSHCLTGYHWYCLFLIGQDSNHEMYSGNNLLSEQLL